MRIQYRQIWRGKFSVYLWICPVTCPVSVVQPVDCSTQRDRWPGNSGRRSLSSFVEPAAAAGWRTGCWNGRRSVTSADSMPQHMMVTDRRYTNNTSAELSYVIRCLTGSQWSSCRTGFIRLYFFVPVMIRAAAFWITCHLCSSLATDTNQDAVAVVESTANKRVYIFVASIGSDCLIHLSCRSWKKQDRLM